MRGLEGRAGDHPGADSEHRVILRVRAGARLLGLAGSGETPRFCVVRRTAGVPNGWGAKARARMSLSLRAWSSGRARAGLTDGRPGLFASAWIRPNSRAPARTRRRTRGSASPDDLQTFLRVSGRFRFSAGSLLPKRSGLGGFPFSDILHRWRCDQELWSMEGASMVWVCYAGVWEEGAPKGARLLRSLGGV